MINIFHGRIRRHCHENILKKNPQNLKYNPDTQCPQDGKHSETYYVL